MSNIKRKINSDLDDRMTLDWQGTRAFFYGLGYNDADIEKPRVGIMNTWNEINPGQYSPAPSGRRRPGGHHRVRRTSVPVLWLSLIHI